ncbi:hypothetical protein ACFWEJ_11910 [Promicromonospora sp. NPDC060204]|uniref:hypothetical protein n=1 Tax=Promicromonospora sp. NPDC060204 TaxID=3347071 RepID=UPI00365F1AA7
MSNATTHPRDDSEYEQLLEEVRAVIDVDRRLPAWPFRNAPGDIDICQYSHAIEGPFGPVLQALADAHGDETMTVVALDPAAAYYHEHYGVYGAFRMAAKAISGSYYDAVAFEPHGDPTGALTFTTDVLAIVGSSGRWSVWAERSWDLALIASDQRNGPWLARGVPFVSAETALADFTEPDFKSPLTTEERDEFLRNVRRSS